MNATPLPPKPAIVPGLGSVWQHHKGTFYRVTEVSRHSEDPEQWLVTYRPIGGGDAWTRALLQRPSNGWPGFMDPAIAGERFRFRHVSGPRSWRDEVAGSEETTTRLVTALPLMLAALKAYRDQYADRESWPDDEVACLDLAEAALAAAAPPAPTRPELKITWRDENYGTESGVVAFRNYGHHLLDPAQKKAFVAACQSVGFAWHERRGCWMAPTSALRKSTLTTVLEALGYDVKHAGAVPPDA